MAGKDWTHAGVAKLYTDIANNGYHILYLTSRAIGQADYTRKYLKNVEQDNYYLPDGPVIMSPDRLMTAFHRYNCRQCQSNYCKGAQVENVFLMSYSRFLCER